MLAFGVAVDIGDSVHARIALGVHETDVLSEILPSRPPPPSGKRAKKSRLTISRRTRVSLKGSPD
jgi:hypothetical protein